MKLHVHIISRDIAISLGMKYYFTGIPCINGHVDIRTVSGHQCRTCKNHNLRKHRENQKTKNNIPEGFKTCKTCKITLPIYEFSENKNCTTDGHLNKCVECERSARRNRYNENKDAILKKNMERYKTDEEYRNNKLIRNHESRQRNAESIRNSKKEYYEKVKNESWYIEKSEDYRLANRSMKREYDKQYSKDNSDKITKRAIRWSNENPQKRRAIRTNYRDRRRSKTECGVSSSELSAWVSIQDKVCYWCGHDCSDGYHIDHYEPLSKGGLHEIDNLVIACPTCNLKKSAKDPYEFAQEKGKLF